MKIAFVIACSAVGLAAFVATAGAARTTVETRAVCVALRTDVGATAFATAFRSAASCRVEAAPFELRTIAAVRRACKSNGACMSALSGTASEAAQRIVVPMQTCASRYGNASLTRAFVACLVSTFRNELNTATRVTIKCTHGGRSHFAVCLAGVKPAPAPVQPAPAPQTTVPASPAPAPVDRCSGGGSGYGPQVECPMEAPTG